MTAAVVDASFLVAILTDEGDEGRAAFAHRGVEMHAPALIRYEVTQVLRRRAGRGVVESGGSAAFGTFVGTTITEWPFPLIAERVWELRQNLSTYDASYVAVAERLGSPLLTFDRRLARAPGLRCEVVVPSVRS